MSLFEELKRRNVIRVVAAYMVLSWLLLQVGDTLLGALEVPDWGLKLLVALLVLGFIPTLVFSWAYELTPEGFKKDSGVDPSGSVAHQTGRKLNVITIGMIVLAIGVLVADRVFVDRGQAPAVSKSVNQSVADQPPTVLDRSIAVLPFLNLSSDIEQEYFSDGLADALLHRLAQIKDLRVAARTSSFKFKGQNEDIRDIARQLGVATVLEGSVQRQGDRVRITAQLIDGSDGSHIWSRVFDDTLDDIFRVQDEIAYNVAGALQATLGDAVTVGTDLGGTDNVTAYEAYLKGVESSKRGTPEAASQAIAQLELAVGLDPDYARAWVALSEAYALPIQLGTATSASTLIPRMNAAEKAVALAPILPEAHLALAAALRFDGGDTERAAAAIEKAAELGPNNAASLAALGQLRTSQGLLRDALRLTERAALINPLDPFLQMDLAYRKFSVGLEVEALALAASVTETNPGNLELLFRFELLLEQNQQWVEAARLAHRVLESNPGMLIGNFILLYTHLRVGDIEQADEYLRRAEAISPNRAWDNRADFCLLTGDLQCYIENTERFLQVAKDGGVSTFEVHEGELRLYEGDYERAIELLQPRVGPRMGNPPRNTIVALYLAAAYDKLGDNHNRDAVLDKTEQEIHESLANGLSIRFALHDLLQVAAIRGDAQLASENLAAAIDANSAPQSGELEHHIFYDSVREHPDFQAQLTRVKAHETEIRAQLTAEKL
jgi:TolB-like protein/tetratricopeptide (TPR) repeat protein